MKKSISNNNLNLFSSKADAYVNSRPSYPRQFVDYIQKECAIKEQSVIVDVGCGTGKLAEIFLESGFNIIGCEPSQEMRKAATSQLERFGEQFACLDACAEATTLANSSVDLILIANALHLFQVEKAMDEFKRILKPNGRIAVLYNFRNLSNELSAEYESLLLKYSRKYEQFTEKFKENKYINNFFGAIGYQRIVADNPHSLNMEQYLDRFYSSAWLNKTDFSILDRKLFESEARTTFRRCLNHHIGYSKDNETTQLSMMYASTLYLSGNS